MTAAKAGHNSDGEKVKEHVRNLVKTMEDLKVVQQELSDHKSELKSEGYDVKAIVFAAKRSMEDAEAKAKRIAHEHQCDIYLNALDLLD